MYVIIFTNSIRWNEYCVIVIRHNLFYEKRKMRIAIYNLQRKWYIYQLTIKFYLIMGNYKIINSANIKKTKPILILVYFFYIGRVYDFIL